MPLFRCLAIPHGGLLLVGGHSVAACQQESDFVLALGITQVRALLKPLRRGSGVATFQMDEPQILTSDSITQACGALIELRAFLQVLGPAPAFAITDTQQVHRLHVAFLNQLLAQVRRGLIILGSSESFETAPGDHIPGIFDAVFGRF